MSDLDQPRTCPLPAPPALSRLTRLALRPDPPLADFRAAMALANAEARARLGEHMLLCWYDRDRDFESPSTRASAIRIAPFPGMAGTASTTAPR